MPGPGRATGDRAPASQSGSSSSAGAAAGGVLGGLTGATTTRRVRVGAARRIPTPDADAPGLPAFPWPVPRASAVASLARRYFAASRTLGEVDTRLTAALGQIGFQEFGHYAAPGGFVLVTRIERIRPDGASWEPDRFVVDDTRAVRLGRSFSLSDYLQALFGAVPGKYRVLAFAVTDRDIVQTAAGLSEAQASALVSRGAIDLPRD